MIDIFNYPARQRENCGKRVIGESDIVLTGTTRLTIVNCECPCREIIIDRFVETQTEVSLNLTSVLRSVSSRKRSKD